MKRLSPSDLHDAWMLAAADAALALASWRAASRNEKRSAYEAYVRALDREADAAWMLQGSIAAVAA